MYQALGLRDQECTRTRYEDNMIKLEIKTRDDKLRCAHCGSRHVTSLIIESTEQKPANVKDVRITLSKGGTVFSPVTRFSSANSGFVNTISLEAAAARVSKLRTTFFIAALEDNLDVTIETLDASGTVLNTRTVASVPFERNRATFLKGSLYSSTGSASFQVETTFEEDYHMEF